MVVNLKYCISDTHIELSIAIPTISDNKNIHRVMLALQNEKKKKQCRQFGGTGIIAFIHFFPKICAIDRLCIYETEKFSCLFDIF